MSRITGVEKYVKRRNIKMLISVNLELLSWTDEIIKKEGVFANQSHAVKVV